MAGIPHANLVRQECGAVIYGLERGCAAPSLECACRRRRAAMRRHCDACRPCSHARATCLPRAMLPCAGNADAPLPGAAREAAPSRQQSLGCLLHCCIRAGGVRRHLLASCVPAPMSAAQAPPSTPHAQASAGHVGATLRQALCSSRPQGWPSSTPPSTRATAPLHPFSLCPPKTNQLNHPPGSASPRTPGPAPCAPSAAHPQSQTQRELQAAAGHPSCCCQRAGGGCGAGRGGSAAEGAPGELRPHILLAAQLLWLAMAPRTFRPPPALHVQVHCRRPRSQVQSQAGG